MIEHADYVHVATSTIREKVQRVIASRLNGSWEPVRMLTDGLLARGLSPMSNGRNC